MPSVYGCVFFWTFASSFFFVRFRLNGPRIIPQFKMKVCNLLANTFFAARLVKKTPQKKITKRKTPLSPHLSAKIGVNSFLLLLKTDSTHANNSLNVAISLGCWKFEEDARIEERAARSTHTHKNKRSQFISVWWQFIACLVIVMLTWARWMQTHYCAIYLLHITRQKFRKKITEERKEIGTQSEKRNRIDLELHLWVESAAVFMCCPSEIVCNMNMETKNKRIHVVGDFHVFFVYFFILFVCRCVHWRIEAKRRKIVLERVLLDCIAWNKWLAQHHHSPSIPLRLF